MKRDFDQTADVKRQTPLRRFRHQPSVEKQVQSPPNKVSSTLYVVDSSHKIIQVGGMWDHFCSSNGGNLPMLKLLGKSLFDFMDPADEDTIYLYRLVHEQLLSRKKSKFVMQQRCDSPTTKRKMRVSISLLDDPDFNLRRILYECHVYDEEERVIDIEDCGSFNFTFRRSLTPNNAVKRTTTDLPNGTPPDVRISKLVEDLVIQCSLCLLIQTDPEVTTWVEVEEFLSTIKKAYQVRLGVCQSCKRKALESLTSDTDSMSQDTGRDESDDSSDTTSAELNPEVPPSASPDHESSSTTPGPSL
eukprot:TRINITY_DN635_c0_g2_i18.p1 TRINITY_DN635_c0_g2~~TRINITY_DN635_c0_g2_i18.p1  ORF type:complete len:302 (+),score=36.56 TRINITY_DN635_c0_g2_i18:141-1046(+)